MADFIPQPPTSAADEGPTSTPTDMDIDPPSPLPYDHDNEDVPRPTFSDGLPLDEGYTGDDEERQHTPERPPGWGEEDADEFDWDDDYGGIGDDDEVLDMAVAIAQLSTDSGGGDGKDSIEDEG